MKTLIIETSPTITRWAVESEVSVDCGEGFNLWGRKHGAFADWLWTDGRERLTAFDDKEITVFELWDSLLDPRKVERYDDANFLILAVLSNTELPQTVDRVVFLVPELLPETSQNAILAALSSQFRIPQKEIYLLWRSVALLLADSPKVDARESCVVLDYGHLVAEFTLLDLTTANGRICPVRDFTREKGSGLSHSLASKDWFNNNYVTLPDEVFQGGADLGLDAYRKLQGDLNFDPPEMWRVKQGYYKNTPFSHDDFAQPGTWEVLENGVIDFMKSIACTDSFQLVWHGWPPFWHGEDVIKSKHKKSILAETDGVLKGGIEFAKRHRINAPTYFEHIPQYRIWCEVTELGLPREWRWEELMPKTRMLGTETFTAKPNERFKLIPGTRFFNMNVREAERATYRFVDQELPPNIEKDTPITIISEIRPTGGGVKFRLKARDEPDLFGQNAELALRWDRAEERKVVDLKPPESNSLKYAYPFIIQTSGYANKRGELMPIAELVANGQNITGFLNQLNLIVPPLMQANQFEVPFGNRPVEEGIDEDLEQLIAEINDEGEWHIQNVIGADASSWKWVRIVGGLFHYASQENQDFLFEEVMRKDFPLSDFKNSSLFWSFGRVCRNPQHLEEYLQRAISKWDNLAGMHYWVFWPFQKSLCYYGKSAFISRATALEVFKCASQMLEWTIHSKVPIVPRAFGKPNWTKWTLAAILFGLRIREIHPDFLVIDPDPAIAATSSVESKLAVEIRDQITNPKILSVPIPPFALKGIDVGPKPPTLGELVLRFLEARADQTDIALAGGIGLSS